VRCGAGVGRAGVRCGAGFWEHPEPAGGSPIRFEPGMPRDCPAACPGIGPGLIQKLTHSRTFWEAWHHSVSPRRPGQSQTQPLCSPPPGMRRRVPWDYARQTARWPPGGTSQHVRRIAQRPGPAPPGTAHHIVPTQHLRYWAGVSSPHPLAPPARAGVRCGAGVGRAGVRPRSVGRCVLPGGHLALARTPAGCVGPHRPSVLPGGLAASRSIAKHPEGDPQRGRTRCGEEHRGGAGGMCGDVQALRAACCWASPPDTADPDNPSPKIVASGWHAGKRGCSPCQGRRTLTMRAWREGPRAVGAGRSRPGAGPQARPG